MSPTTSKTLILQNPPTTDTDLSLGGVNSTFKLESQSIPELNEGQYLVSSSHTPVSASSRSNHPPSSR